MRDYVSLFDKNLAKLLFENRVNGYMLYELNAAEAQQVLIKKKSFWKPLGSVLQSLLIFGAESTHCQNVGLLDVSIKEKTELQKLYIKVTLSLINCNVSYNH